MKGGIRLGWLAGLVIFFVLGAFRVGPGERAVVRSGEVITRNNIAPGWHLHRPLFDQVDIVPARTLVQVQLDPTQKQGAVPAGTQGRVWAWARVEDAAKFAQATGAGPAALQEALQTAVAAQPTHAPEAFKQLAQTALSPFGLVVEQAGGDVIAAAPHPAVRVAPETLAAAERGTLTALRAERLSPALTQAAQIRAQTAREVAAILAPPPGADAQAATFDRAAQSYRRARLQGQAVSLEDARFAPLKAWQTAE